MNKKLQLALEIALGDILPIAIPLIIYAGVADLPPFERPFSPSDPAISLPYQLEDSVSTMLAGGISQLIPLGLMVPMGFFWARSKRGHPGWAIYRMVIALAFAFAINLLITEALKRMVGRLRPDFLGRCAWNGTECTGDPEAITDGRQSFPSGHSSASFQGFGFFALYIAGVLDLFKRRGGAYKLFIFAIPLFAAALVALSRIKDNRHHWGDILFGSGLGMIVAACSYYSLVPIPGETEKYDQDRQKKDDDISLDPSAKRLEGGSV